VYGTNLSRWNSSEAFLSTQNQIMMVHVFFFGEQIHKFTQMYMYTYIWGISCINKRVLFLYTFLIITENGHMLIMQKSHVIYLNVKVDVPTVKSQNISNATLPKKKCHRFSTRWWVILVGMKRFMKRFAWRSSLPTSNQLDNGYR